MKRGLKIKHLITSFWENKMIRKFFYSSLCIVMLTGLAFGFDVTMEPCLNDVVPQMTDIKFVSSDHAFITTQPGDIYWFQGCNEELQKLATVDVATSSRELGLYSIAVAPDFSRSANVFLYYTAETDGRLTTRLSAFKLDRDKIPNALVKEKILLEINQPYTNSNGGVLRFGPDGLLYLGVGDGGDDGDPEGNAQNIHSILGSIVRIKPALNTPKGYTIPDGNLQDFITGALPEIFAYGVHNPWKFTFDDDGNMIIADVGEHTIEEVDVISWDMIGTQAINLGWNIKEGDMCFNPSEGCDSPGLIDPVYQYEHYGDAGNSITGGETIRLGDKEYYLFGDFMTGQLGVLDLEAPATPVFEKRFESNWVTFAKNNVGCVYVADYNSGTLYQIMLNP